MPKALDSAFIAAKNARSRRPIWLFRIHRTAGEDLYLAKARANVNYFKDTDTAQEYIRWPMRIDSGVEESSRGDVPRVRISVSNATREIQAYLEDEDFFRGCKVTIRMVWGTALANAAAYLEREYYVDAVSANERLATFELTSAYDVRAVEVPLRRQLRETCPAPVVYKGHLCHLDDGDGTYSAPAGFTTDKTAFMTTKTKSASGNPAAPGVGVATREWTRLINKATDQLILDLRIGSGTPTSTSGILIGTNAGGSWNYDDYVWLYSDLTALSPALSTNWATYTLELADFTQPYGNAPDLEAFNAIRAFTAFSSGSHTLQMRNVYLVLKKPFGTVLTDLDFCNKTRMHCRLHGNIQRFGGFPSIPGQRPVVV